jgi:NAD(P)-dependent dehydrogenase (short-subunit alcohol dehydrogenase family)
VAPGFIATDMTAATAARLGMTFEDFQAAAASQVPARRIGEVDDVAHAISFLASEGARYISGRRPVSSCISGPTSRWYYLLIEKSRNFVQYILVVDLVR